ncbi:hypothetical protein F5884DRAFT_1399 [Xylogone sp. PMI_703]|nr:hypothetical protein F5884DRAFT_1399 [Xylogone sp. PMI_703]
MLFQLALLSFLSLVAGAPVDAIQAESVQNAWKYGTGGGIIGFIVLILDIIVFIEVLQSTRPPLKKVLWCLLVFLFPIGGLIIYYLFSNREAHRGSGAYEPIG